ncbi:MAG: hypothetical protein KGQ49_02780, partial [Verrucomicrobia bacterium]|nr:hypothetical protein [Verrucomicrobiota bacterium]
TVYRYSPRIYHKQYQTTLLEAMRVLTEPDKLQVARDLIQGLSTLHENRIVNKALSDLEHYLINIDRQSQTIEAVIGHFDSSEVLRSTHDNTSPLICHPYAQDVLDLGCILDRLFSTHWSYSHTPQEPRIQDLIQKMTHRDPQSRITAQQANQEFQDILKTL